MEPDHTEVTTPASVGVVTLAEVKDHLQIFGTSSDTTYDDYLKNLILAADKHASDIIGQSLSRTEYTDSYSGWDARLMLSATQIDAKPVVRYYDGDNTLRTVAAADFFLDESAAEKAVVFTTTQTAILSKHVANPVQAVYDSVYLSASSQSAIKQAVLMLIADLFEQRESMTSEKSVMSYLTAEQLLLPYRTSRA